MEGGTPADGAPAGGAPVGSAPDNAALMGSPPDGGAVRPARHGPLALARARLLAQGLIPGFGRQPGAAATARWMTMMQAQDLRQAFWALGVRNPGIGATGIRDAFNEGTIVRTWGARGTLMLLAPETVGPLLQVTAPRMRAAAAGRHRQLGITADDVDSLVPVALECCVARGATREELLAAFRDAGQDTAGQRGIHLLFELSVRGVLVQGPMADDGATHRQLFVPYEAWLRQGQPNGTGVPHGPEQALAAVAASYFRSHGPATDRDFAWWLGVPLRQARSAIAFAAGALASRTIAGGWYWMDERTAQVLDAQPNGPGSRSLLVLPGFDELLLGYRDRTATLAERHAQQVVPGGNGMFRRTVAAGGATVGTWSPGGTRYSPVARSESFDGALTPARRRAFDARVHEYERFLAE